MRSTGATFKAGLMLQSYVANAYFWANWPNEVSVTPDWQDVTFEFTIPKPGDANHHPEMKLFRVRVDMPAEAGTLEVTGVQLHEAESLDEWASWQLEGMDRASVVADPKLLHPGTDDPALAPDSPALKLGFKPIAWDRIGPYADPRRATWPIQQAPGAREFPVRVPTTD